MKPGEVWMYNNHYRSRGVGSGPGGWSVYMEEVEIIKVNRKTATVTMPGGKIRDVELSRLSRVTMENDRRPRRLDEMTTAEPRWKIENRTEDW